MKVYLSPSNQPNNKCKLGHSEKEHCQNLADLILPYLRAYNIEYMFRREGTSLSQSVRDATAWGAQIYIPIHTNATLLGKAMGTRFGFYPGRMDSSNACDIFKRNWITLYPYPAKVKTGTYKFYEAKYPKCPSVYVELVFHDNINDATWFHQNMGHAAQNLAKSIAEFFGIGNKIADDVLETKSIVDGHIIKMTITKDENAKFFSKPIGAIVEIPIEEYLMSVVPAEVGNAHIEACKAQAIAARSIVYYWTKSGNVINDTSAYQSFRASRGTDNAYTNAHNAVKETKGQVLLYDGKIAQTYFADSNGGKMVASGEHWSQSLPYLVTKNDPWTLASGKPFNGHPVGMSQQGAIWAANHGVKYDGILAFYYPGTEIQPKNTNPIPTPNPEPEQPPTQNQGAIYTAEVVTKNPLSLNIWKDANKDVSLKRVPRGSYVEVLQEVNQTWAKVRYAGVEGYSDRQYLKRQNEQSDVLYTATVKTRFPLSLNIWKDANKGTSLVKVPNGVKVDVLGEVNSTWAKVRYNGTVGFSDRQYLVK